MSYICQTEFEKICGHIFNVKDCLDIVTQKPTLIDNPNGIKNFYYVKTSYLKIFNKNYDLQTPYYLITGSSDISITEQLFKETNTENLIKWFSVNVAYKHPKLCSIPIGVIDTFHYTSFNKEFGNHQHLTNVINSQIKKTNHIYSNFKVNNNFKERSKCIKYTNIQHQGNGLDYCEYSEYLKNLASYKFCLAPDGNGVDTHRLWESLYLKTIPIVTRSINVESYEKKFPIIVLDSWTDFNINIFTDALYNRMMKGFDFTNYDISNFIR